MHLYFLYGLWTLDFMDLTMLDFHQKRKVRSVIYNRTTLVVLGILVLIVIHSTWVVYKKKKESESLKTISLNNVEELRKRDKELEARIERLSTTPGIEEEIRSKFSVAKQNENVVIIVSEEAKKASSTSKNDSFWQKIKDFFTK